MKKVIKFVKGKKEEESSKALSIDSKKSPQEKNVVVEEQQAQQQQPTQHRRVAGGSDAGVVDEQSQLEEFLSADKSITKLHKAVWAENTDKLRSIIKTHDIDITDRLDRTALYYAVLKENADLAELLLENGASHSIPDIDGVTPLLRAVHQGARDCVLALLKHGADLKRVDKDLNGCLHYAVSARRHSLLSLLVNQAADCNQHNAAGECPLHIAARLGEAEMAETLLTFGAATDVADIRGGTALMAAATAGHADIAALLLAHNADPDIRDAQGKTAAEHALSSGFKEIAVKLKSGSSVQSAGPASAHGNDSDTWADSPVSTPPSRRAACQPEPRDKQLARIAEKFLHEETDISEDKSESDVSMKRSENASPQSGVIPPPCKPLRSLEYLQAGRGTGEDSGRPLHLLTLGTVRTRHISMTESEQSRGNTPHRYSYQGDLPSSGGGEQGRAAAPDLVAYCCPPAPCHEPCKPPVAAPRSTPAAREDCGSAVPSDWGSNESLPLDELPPPRKHASSIGSKDNTFLQKQFSLLEDYEKKHSRTCSAVTGAVEIATLLEDNGRINAHLERYAHGGCERTCLASKSRSLPRSCEQQEGSYRAGSMSLPRTLDCGRDFIRDMKRYGSYRPTKTHYIYQHKHKADSISSSKKHGFIEKLKNVFGKKAQIHLSDSTDANQTWLPPPEDSREVKCCSCAASHNPPQHSSECTKGLEKKVTPVGSTMSRKCHSRKSSGSRSSVETPLEESHNDRSPSLSKRPENVCRDLVSVAFCPDCAEYAGHKLAEVRRELDGRESLVRMLQWQLEQMQERNLRTITEQQEMTYKYYQASQELVSVRALAHKYEDEVRRLLGERCVAARRECRCCHVTTNTATPAPLPIASAAEESPDKWKTQCCELETEAETLRVENARMSGQVCELQAELSRATQRLLELEQSTADTRRDIDNELRDRNDQLEKELDKIRAGYDKLQTIYSETETAFNESVDQHGCVISANESLKQENKELRERLAELSKRVVCMRSSALMRNSVLRAELKKSRVPCTQCEEGTSGGAVISTGRRVTFDESSKELACVRLDTDAVCGEAVETAMSQIERLNDEYSEMHLKLQEAGMRERLERVEQENDRLVEEIEEQRKLIARLETLASELKEENAEGCARIGELLEENDQLKKGFEEMLTEIEHMRADAKLKSASIKQQECLLGRHQQRAEAQARDAEERLRILQCEHDKKCCKITALEVTNAEGAAKIVGLEENLEMVTMERDRLQEDVEQLKREKRELVESLERTREELERSREELSRIEAGLCACHSNLERLQAANQQLRLNAERVSEEAREGEQQTEDAIIQLNTRLQQLDHDNNRLIDQVTQARHHCDFLEKQLSGMREQLRRKEDECTRRVTERPVQEKTDMNNVAEVLRSILSENMQRCTAAPDLDRITSEIMKRLETRYGSMHLHKNNPCPRRWTASRIPKRLSSASIKKVSVQTTLSEIGETESRNSRCKPRPTRSASLSDKNLKTEAITCAVCDTNSGISRRSSSMPSLLQSNEESEVEIGITNEETSCDCPVSSQRRNTCSVLFKCSLMDGRAVGTLRKSSSMVCVRPEKSARPEILTRPCENNSMAQPDRQYRDLISRLQGQVATLQERAQHETCRNFDLETELNALRASVASVADMDGEIAHLRAQLERERATRIHEFEIAKIRKEEELREFRQKIKEEFLSSKHKCMCEQKKTKDLPQTKTADENGTRNKCEQLKKEVSQKEQWRKEVLQQPPYQRARSTERCQPSVRPPGHGQACSTSRTLRFQLDNSVNRHRLASGSPPITRSLSQEELEKKYLLK